MKSIFVQILPNFIFLFKKWASDQNQRPTAYPLPFISSIISIFNKLIFRNYFLVSIYMENNSDDDDSLELPKTKNNKETLDALKSL